MTTLTCSGVAFEITPTDGTNGIVPEGTLYTWSAPTGVGISGGVTQTIPRSSIVGTLSNTTNITRTATYIVTSSAPCGAVTSFTLTVTLNPTAEITAMSTVTCSGVTFNVTPTDIVNGIVPAGTTFTWSAPTTTGSINGGSSASGVSIINGTLHNTSNTAQTATYIITPSTVACGPGLPFTLSVTVSPIGIITPISTTTCTGVLFTVTPTDVTNGVVPTGTLFSWSAPTGAGFTGGATQVAPRVDVIGTLNNTTNSVKTATYLVTPTRMVVLASYSA